MLHKLDRLIAVLICLTSWNLWSVVFLLQPCGCLTASWVTNIACSRQTSHIFVLSVCFEEFGSVRPHWEHYHPWCNEKLFRKFDTQGGFWRSRILSVSMAWGQWKGVQSSHLFGVFSSSTWMPVSRTSRHHNWPNKLHCAMESARKIASCRHFLSFQKENETATVEVLSTWHPNLTINLIDDHTPWVKGSVPQPLDDCTIYSVLFINFTNWSQDKHVVPTDGWFCSPSWMIGLRNRSTIQNALQIDVPDELSIATEWLRVSWWDFCALIFRYPIHSW